MAPTREQFQLNIAAMEKQGAPPKDIQSYLDSFKGQQPVAQDTTVATEQPPKQEDGFFTSLIKSPIKTLLVEPTIRAGQALAGAGVYAFGDEALKQKADKYFSQAHEFNIPVLGKYNIEPIKQGVEGLKQVAGKGLEAGSYLAGAGGVAGATKSVLKRTLGTAIKEGVIGGAKAGALYGTGSTLQKDNAGAIDVLKGAAEGGLAGGAIGGAFPIAFSGASKILGRAKSEITSRIAQQAENKALLEGGATDARVATKMFSPEGKIITDQAAKEAVKQGIPEADIALIKGSSEFDKVKMGKMLNIRKSQTTNKRIIDRATDVVGNTFTENIAKPIEKLNKEAGKKLDAVAQGLAGKKVDATSALTQLEDDIKRAGVSIKKDGTLNFKNSNFEGIRGAQQSISAVWNRAIRIAKSGDALQTHRTKSFIDEVVNYGKNVEGLSGKAQMILKNFRHNLDASLDTKFPIYNKVNTQFSDTIKQLNNMGMAIGRSFKLGDTFADSQAGLAMRRILSNTKSRSEILSMLDGMQQVLKKYGIKNKEDIINQANFADLLETIFKSEAPTSFLGQGQRFGGTGMIGEGVSLAREATKWSPVSASIRGAEYLYHVTRGINQENKIKALEALLESGKKVSNFGIPKGERGALKNVISEGGALAQQMQKAASNLGKKATPETAAKISPKIAPEFQPYKITISKNLQPLAQLSQRELDFIKSKGVDVSKIDFVKDTKSAKDILAMLNPENQKDVLSKVGRPTTSTSNPILIQGKNGIEILDGSHALAKSLKENKSIDFYNQSVGGVKKSNFGTIK